ncbi:MAG: WbuC family cupin fold metalloprotein [Bacteroidales bacterium]
MIKIDNLLIQKVSEEAQISIRQRKNYNFHKSDEDNFQRLMNAIEPFSYIQPHKHENPDKREVFFVLRGKLLVVEFDEKGEITDHIILDALTGNIAVEIPEKTWHTIISLEKSSVAYECKDGPYNPIDDKNFASWAPKEGAENCREFIDNILHKLNLKISGF